MKNQKGITLISLVMTVILIMVLTGIGTYTGLESYENMRIKAFVAKMKTVQEAVDKLCTKYTIEEINEMGTDYEFAPGTAKTVLLDVIAKEDSKMKSWYSVDEIKENYRYFEIADITNILGIKNFDTDIWFNPITRNIVAISGVEFENEMYYRQYDLNDGAKLPEPNINVNFTLEVSVKTYDNKAEILLLKNSEETIFSKIKYYKLKEGTTEYGDPHLLTNASKITLTESGTYRVEATDSTENTQTQEGIVVTIVNKPLLVDGMTPVIDADNDGIFGENAAEQLKPTEAEWADWYNYGEDVKNWANVKLKDGSIYVWIPRFAYKIDSTNKKIDVKFLKDFSQIGTDGKALSSSYKVAPAFKDGTENGFANGEWDEEITGFWVAKYEPVNNSSKPKSAIVTDAESWRSIDPKDAFAICRKMEADYRDTYFNSTVAKASGTYTYGVYATDTNNIDTHLIKNSEWGAVAYLTYSKHGINKQPTAKPSYYVDDNITGEYSSTGNYTGVYGMNAGAHEVVAAGETIANFYNSENVSTKYATVYATNSADNNIYGDAMKETSGWDGNKEVYPNETNRICRGGFMDALTIAGIFAYENKVDDGGNDQVSFRPILIVEY